jgi:hypothetical protein
MSWFETVANETESAKNRYHMFIAVDFDFPSGHVRLWTGSGLITLSGSDYLGIGDLGRVSPTVDRSNLTVERKTYQLQGAIVDPALVSEADIDDSFGRAVVEYLGFLNNDTHQLLATPEINFEGEISNIRRVDGPEPMIEVNADSRLIMLDQNDGWRYTHQHQIEFFPALPLDLGFNEMPKLDTREVLWGGRRVIAGVGGNSGPIDQRRPD